MSNQAPKDRIASAPSLEDAQTYGSACCNSTSTEHHPNCPVRSVEACDQPVCDHCGEPVVMGKEGLMHKNASDPQGQFWCYCGGTINRWLEVTSGRSQSHPSLQESGDRSADDYRPSKFHLSNSEVRSTGLLCGGAVQAIARELLELRSQSPEPPAGPAFEEWPDSMCVYCGSQMPSGTLQRCLVRKKNFCTHEIPMALSHFLRARSTPIDLNATREEGENATEYVSVYETLGAKIDKLEEDLHMSKMECADLVSRTLMAEAKLNEQLKGK